MHLIPTYLHSHEHEHEISIMIFYTRLRTVRCSTELAIGHSDCIL